MTMYKSDYKPNLRGEFLCESAGCWTGANWRLRGGSDNKFPARWLCRFCYDKLPGTTSQCNTLLQFLRGGHSVTRLEAMVNLGIGNLPARVNDIRNLGYCVRTEMVTERGKRFARYSLVGP